MMVALDWILTDFSGNTDNKNTPCLGGYRSEILKSSLVSSQVRVLRCPLRRGDALAQLLG